jgi:hypothetical protein
MKKLIKKVELSFFKDDGNGEWGLCHKNTQDSDNGFNAFWTGQLFFHDVFEHSHEHENKYFRDQYAMNIGGEMAAMGAFMYYVETLGIHNRIRSRGLNSIGYSARITTQSDVIEAITDGYCRYGSTLECNVPKQLPVYSTDLEYEIEQYWKIVKSTQIETTDNNEREYAQNYKDSVTFRKIADLHRYGYRMAERFVPDNWDNQTTLNDFVTFWDDFCKNNNAEELANNFEGLTFYIYKENNRITWKAILESNTPTEIENVTITEKSPTYSLELADYMIFEEEHEEN